MIKIYRTKSDVTSEISTIEQGAWIKLVAPTEEEINFVSQALNVEAGLLKAATDEEERARLDIEDNATLIVVDTPIVSEKQSSIELYSTMPLGII